MAKSPTTSSQSLGNYVLRKKLGAGAMGEVWLARDKLLDREVAVKLLHAGADNERMLKDFLREAQAAAKLNHPNTVTIYQIGKSGGKVFIAMEYVEGGSLADELQNKGALPWRKATQAIRDAAAGLKAAHERGLVHRDIKPSNLMRSSSGLVKVVDFGLAKSRDGNTDMTMTQPGTILGSPAYMSPEQCRGETADARSDLYSLICAYYQLLTRQIPFAAPEATAAMYLHCHETFPDPASKGFALPEGVGRILARGSRKKPEERYQTAAELIADLDVVLNAPEASHIFETGTAGAKSAASRTSARLVSILRGKGIMGKTTWALVILMFAWLAFMAPRRFAQAPAPTPDDSETQLAANGAGLKPAPTAAVQYKAEQTVKTIFKDDYAQHNDTAHQTLALKLLAQGQQPGDDPVMQFVLLREARDVAALAGNLGVAFQAIDEAAKGFDIDAVDLKTAALLTVSHHTNAPVDVHALAESGLQVFDQAVAADHYADAARLGPVLESAAAKSKDVPLLQKVQSRRRQMADLRREFDKQKSFFDALRKDPADPGANLALGRYLCFSKSNWESGLLMLAKGSDAALKNLAAAELAGPTEAAAQLRLADGWWDQGAQQDSAAKPAIEHHAGIWYQKAFPALSEADQARTKARLPKDVTLPVAVAIQKGFALDLGAGVSMKFVLIPAGKFMMGSPEKESGLHDKQEVLHQVTLSRAFLMATTTVTQAQWKAVMGNNPSKFQGNDLPVEQVSWNEAAAFCEKLSAKEGKHFRLPTEAEWEYACRAGTQTAYGGTNNLDEMGWYEVNSNGQTHPVAQKKPNAWGLYDMHGNVFQMCSDGFGAYGGDAVDPKGTDNPALRVLRGGSWRHDPWHCRAAARDRLVPGTRSFSMGFRVCLDF